MKSKRFAVTGAFSYSGKYITRKLLAAGAQVITLTGSPDRPDPFNGQVPAHPFNFDDPDALTASLQGIDTLVNTYWVRFDHGDKTFSRAVANTKTLFAAAQKAGVQQVIHVSISNPSLSSPLPYFAGKAELEQTLIESGLSYAILRPTVIYGQEDILINNIAWLLRHFPIFAVPGDGGYRLQPIYVEDMAELVVQAAQQTENLIWDAVGPEDYSFNELVHTIAQVLDRRPWIVHVPPTTAYVLSGLIGRLVGDVMLTRDELKGLMDNLLVSEQPARGHSSLLAWLRQHKESLGSSYANEIARHYR